MFTNEDSYLKITTNLIKNNIKHCILHHCRLPAPTDINLNFSKLYSSSWSFLKEFISDLIFWILFKPSCVKWPLDAISLDTPTRGRGSLDLDPTRGYFSKKGIIFSRISFILETRKLTAAFPAGSDLPHSKKIF